MILAATIAVYNANAISAPLVESYSSMALSLFFPSIVFSYMLYRGNTISGIISELGLSRDRITAKMIIVGISLFLAVVLFGLALSAFSQLTNIQLPTNVQAALAGTPAYFLVFTFLIAPINEEIFFRGFMVPRLGIIASAIIFALLHLSYISVSEFAAALFFGLLAGYVFRRTKSLYPSIVAHAIVNFVTVAALFSMGSFLVHI
ncbi:MAG: CPBP family intramembrane metalloprotease [Candidatus Micrarchaeota archaeon]|nr:CPBP family intramembrane metalloprotease [Candidatus Micrarchaeota archaeon]